MPCYSFTHGFTSGLDDLHSFSHGFTSALLEDGADDVYEFTHGFTSGLTENYSFTHGFTSAIYPEDVLLTYAPPDSTPAVVLRAMKAYRNDFGYQVLFHKSPGGAVDLTPYVKSGSIHQELSNPATLTLDLVDAERLFIPNPSNGAPFYHCFEGASFGTTFNIRQYITVDIWSKRQRWRAPKFLDDGGEWTIDNTGQRVFRVTAMDLSALLLQDDQQLDDYLSHNLAPIWSSSGVIADICGHYGIKVRNHGLSYPVRQFSPKGGTALDYIRQLLYVTQSEWYFDQDVLVIKQPSWSKGASQAWKILDIHDIRNLSYKKSSRDLKNEFVIKKVEKAGTPLLRMELNKYGESGLQELNPPSAAIDSVVLEANYGFIDTFTWWDESKNILGLPTVGSLRHGRKAKFVQVNYNPTVNPGYVPGLTQVGQYANGSPPHAIIEFWGVNRPEDMGPFDESYNIWFKAANRSRFGPRRDRSPIENALIPNAAFAQALARALAANSERRCQFSNWEGILNPFMMPGENIGIKCGQAGFYVPTTFYTEGLDKNFGSAADFLMQVECSGNQA